MLIDKSLIEALPDRNKSGNCFSIHLHLQHAVRQLTLVHGVVVGQGPIEGIEHSHCWLEYEVDLVEMSVPMVLDVSNGKSVQMPAHLYYHIGKIKQDWIKRYDYAEAAKNALKIGHYGPWHRLPEHVV